MCQLENEKGWRIGRHKQNDVGKDMKGKKTIHNAVLINQMRHEKKNQQ